MLANLSGEKHVNMGCSTGVLHRVVVAGLSVLFVSPKRSVKKDTSGDYRLLNTCGTLGWQVIHFSSINAWKATGGHPVTQIFLQVLQLIG
ncbi:hypothetical protein GOODEAATRI_029184 [Goodea atripinnis]|uniref:Uncharacterized protein n=1 Tax=Goodea atripinnis TaxID=208336 RepID=A0ABV0MLP7_9TELE